MDTPTGMSGFITALTGANGLSADSLWTVLTNLVPYLIVIVPVALGFYFVRKLIKGTSRAKVRM